MTHPEAYFEDILENPNDDAPRFRYADWLDEHCDPLGEFIRVQCRLAHLPPDHFAILELETRERELLHDNESRWVGDLADFVDWWTFRRGFVDEISTTSANFLAHACTLFQRAPIQEVHLNGPRDDLESLAASAFLQRAAYLDLSNNHVRDQGARLLARSPHMAHVRGLNLSSSGIGDSGLKALATSPHLCALRELYLCDNRITTSGVRALAQSALAEHLQLLHLRFNCIGTDGADLLQRRFGTRVQL
ncbi:MAG: TIGR02996 domain-containing protein [Gemmataceae bacterium]|nr:TIGR02996 domain-containing protein [Gemmataceae bacterium]MCI0739014.1 TIGR02996 domain-containing protein [Gemmataceae bacterium]